MLSLNNISYYTFSYKDNVKLTDMVTAGLYRSLPNLNKGPSRSLSTALHIVEKLEVAYVLCSRYIQKMFRNGHTRYSRKL